MAGANVISATFVRPARGVTAQPAGQRPVIEAVSVPGEQGALGPGGSVGSVNGRTGNVALTAADVALGNVANLAPANLPVSTAQAQADTAVRVAAADDATAKANSAQGSAIATAASDATNKANAAQAAAISAAAMDASAKASTAQAAAVAAAATDATSKAIAAQSAAITAAATDATAKANARAAAGANSDIKSLSGLTTPLSVLQGGTGATAIGDAAFKATGTATGTVMAGDDIRVTGIGYINARAQGVIGDGSAADMLRWQAAVQLAITLQRPLYLPAGTYIATDMILSDTVLGSSGFPGMYGDGDQTVILHRAAGKALFRRIGTLTAPTGAPTITAAVPSGTIVLPVSSTAGFAAGDYIAVQDQGQIVLSRGDPVACTGQIVRILSVDSATQLTLKGQTEFAYTTQTVIRKFGFVPGFKLSDLLIKNETPGSLGGSAVLDLYRVRGVQVRRVTFQNMDGASIRMDHCLDFEIESIVGLDYTYEAGNPAPYMIAVASGCANGRVSKCLQRSGRHLITSLTTSSNIESAHIVVSDCIAHETGLAGFDQHGGARHWTFNNCQTYAGRILDPAVGTSMGIQCRGRFTTINNLTAVGVTLGAFMVYGSDNRIIGGQFDQCDVGIKVDSSPNIDVIGPKIRGARTNAVWVRNGDAGTVAMPNIRISDIDVVGNPSGGAINFENWENSYALGAVKAPDAATVYVGVPGRAFFQEKVAKEIGASLGSIPGAAVTGTQFLGSCLVPAGGLGKYGEIEIDATWIVSSSANNKTIRVYLGSTPVFSLNLTGTTLSYRLRAIIKNLGNETSQTVQIFAPGGNTSTPTPFAIDTTIDQMLQFSLGFTATTDTGSLQMWKATATRRTA